MSLLLLATQLGFCFFRREKECLLRESRFSEPQAGLIRRPFKKGENNWSGTHQALCRVHSDSRLDLRIPDAKLPTLRHAATRFDSPPARLEFGRTLRIIYIINTAQGVPNSFGLRPQLLPFFSKCPLHVLYVAFSFQGVGQHRLY